MTPSTKTSKIAIAILLAIFSASCIKDTLTPRQSVPVVAATDGGILDLGEISAGVHHYSISLSSVTVAMANSADTPMTTAANIELCSNTDGIINDGTYHYSESGEISPFVFKSGSIYATPATPDSYGAFMVKSGSVSVLRKGITYEITINGEGTTGEKFTGSSSGTLSYKDVELPY